MLAPLAAPAYADTPITDPNSGYAIPRYGDDEEIVNTFQAPDGHLVFEIWFKRDGQLHDDFFDTKSLKRMHEKQEIEIAENDTLREGLIKKALEKLEPDLFTLKLPDSTEIHDSYTGEMTCVWPYDSEIMVQLPDEKPIEHALYIALDKPHTKMYHRDCDIASGSAKLTTNYRKGFALFLPDDNGGFWAIVADSPYAIHFDRKGKSAFFKNRKDIILVPAAALNKLRDDADLHATGSAAFYRCAGIHYPGRTAGSGKRMTDTVLANQAYAPGVRDYIELLKPRVMSLVVFSGFVGLMAAPGHIHPLLGFVTILCIALSAGGSAAVNMWYDRDIDAIMTRTRTRPLPQGRIEPETALEFGGALIFASVMLMWLAVNPQAAGLLALAAAFYIFVYTMWLKRRTPQNIVIGGAAGAFPPVIAWAAVTGHVNLAGNHFVPHHLLLDPAAFLGAGALSQ